MPPSKCFSNSVLPLSVIKTIEAYLASDSHSHKKKKSKRTQYTKTLRETEDNELFSVQT